MPAPVNAFKAALAARRLQIGLWVGLADPYMAEISAGAGFDWLLIDGEHGPNDIRTLLAQLQSVAALPTHPVVRVPVGEAWILKQVLDIGAQTVLVPMVETAVQADQLVRAVRYPPDGTRGVGAALARASAFNRIGDYLTTANRQVCLLVQVENREGLRNIREIAAVDGVDGVFVGPSDLAADLGHLGNPGAPEVQAEVEEALAAIMSFGKAAGILTADVTLAKRYIELGATFVAVGTDVTVFARALGVLRTQFGSETVAKNAVADAAPSY